MGEKERKRRRLEREKRQMERQGTMNRGGGSPESSGENQEKSFPLPIVIPTFDEYIAYSKKFFGLSIDKMKSNALFVKDELTSSQFPKRVYKSSERLVGQFAWSASLFQKTGEQCITKAWNFLGFSNKDDWWKKGGGDGVE